MSVKGVFSAFICGSSGLLARLLKYLKGRLMAVPAGKCRGLMPVLNFPVYVGGICYFQLPAGEYDFYDVLSQTDEPVCLGRYFVAAGEVLRLGEKEIP
ncbi:MAG TPA: hypothetical protein PLK28_18800 [Candidatus Rifleibacterium sp.]|nr:hypothetical protein [Candidatus Rifleibacterium sp.]